MIMVLVRKLGLKLQGHGVHGFKETVEGIFERTGIALYRFSGRES